MNWNDITTFISQLFDKPIIIALSVVFTVMGPTLFIFSKTSVGRKAIRQFHVWYDEGLEIARETKKTVEEVKLYTEEQINAYKGVCEEKIATLISIVNFYEESVFSILDEVPNAKVHAKLEEFKESYQAKKEEIAQVVKVTFQDYENQIEEKVEEQVAEYKEKERAIDERLLLVDSLIKQYQAKLEELDNVQESEETKDTNPDQEEI